MKPRKPIPKVSAKRLAREGDRAKFSSFHAAMKKVYSRKKRISGKRGPAKARQPIKRSPLKKWRRKPSEFARIYGSKARVAWFKALRCAWCEMVGEPFDSELSDNAHTVTGGKGRKADHETIIPLCREHRRKFDERRMWEAGRQSLIDKAPLYHARWLAHSGTSPETNT